MDTNTFDTLDEAIAARMIEWDRGRTDLSFMGLELGGECGEAQNKLKKLERDRYSMTHLSSAEQLNLINEAIDEIADVIICARRVAHKLGRLGELDYATRLKFNRTSAENNLRTRVLV